MSSNAVFLDIFIGDSKAYESQKGLYEHTADLLSKNASIYGLPSRPEDLDDEQRGILTEINQSSTNSLIFESPSPLLAGRLTIDLDPSQGLSKTRNNFLALCTGEKGPCKNAPNKKLHYLNVSLHRIMKGFIAQGGDVTRGDGSGGESIYGAKFNDDKAGLKTKPSYGCLAMANSGKNTNSSQFFIVLTEDETKLSKLAGKYVMFGQVRLDHVGRSVLQRLDEVGGEADGVPKEPVWIGACGTL